MGEQAPVGEDHESRGVIEASVKVELEGDERLFVREQLSFYLGLPGGRQEWHRQRRQSWGAICAVVLVIHCSKVGFALAASAQVYP